MNSAHGDVCVSVAVRRRRAHGRPTVPAIARPHVRATPSCQFQLAQAASITLANSGNRSRYDSLSGRSSVLVAVFQVEVQKVAKKRGLQFRRCFRQV